MTTAIIMVVTGITGPVLAVYAVGVRSLAALTIAGLLGAGIGLVTAALCRAAGGQERGRGFRKGGKPDGPPPKMWAKPGYQPLPDTTEETYKRLTHKRPPPAGKAPTRRPLSGYSPPQGGSGESKPRRFTPPPWEFQCPCCRPKENPNP